MHFQDQALNDILSDMDIPEFRRDTSKPENVRWLLRNLASRNRAHEGFMAATAILRRKAKNA